MHKLLIISILLLSFNSQAESKMTPGLWEIKMKIFQDGKEFDPMAEIKKQMDKMPEAQRKMILEQMSKNGTAAAGNVSQVCYTKEMVDSPEKIKSDETEDCDHKIISKTDKKIVSEFKCKDGNRGKSTWEMINTKQTKVQMEAVDAKGKKTEMKYEAKFLKTKC